jgi:hypothetical protein
MPENQEQVFASVGGESVRAPVIAEHVVQTGVSEHEAERDREPTFVTAGIVIASGEPQRDLDVGADTPREPATEDKEAGTGRALRVPPTFDLPPDLVQVETTGPGSVQQGQANPAPAAEERVESRTRRPRPPDEQVPTEPLVQVETRH